MGGSADGIAGRDTAAGASGWRVRRADRRAKGNAVRVVLAATVAVLVLAGPAAGGPAVATPPGARPSLPDSTKAALASHGLRVPALPRNVTATRAAVIRLVNRERAKAGCRPVRAHRTVTEAAQRHSDHMARDGSLSHRERGGSGPGSRLSAVGYDWRRAGENIARGQRGAAEVVRAWARSPEHRVVLADCAFRHAGVGINSGTDDRGPWWTLLLARPM
ncbi:CAP domain-containing protein [Streptomyces sp. NPDC052496]|uniref:CAP domain-containing protein n=1 Tax=Streptomyces sp. NPDC052496 TaxID=3154951 RepID=UPI00343A0461